MTVSHVRRFQNIVEAIIGSGWSLDNIVFGSGGGLLQDCNRDTLRFAMKCSAVCVDGQWRDVYKRPASDPAKNSKRGKLKLVKKNGVLTTVSKTEAGVDELGLVFVNGHSVLSLNNLSDIRERADV